MTDGDWQNLWIGLVEINAVALKSSNSQTRANAIQIQMNLFEIYSNVAQSQSAEKTSEIYLNLQDLYSEYVTRLSELTKAEFAAYFNKYTLKEKCSEFIF